VIPLSPMKRGFSGGVFVTDAGFGASDL
jgi:hypothetical protein